jgi:phage-related holin
MKSTLLYSLTTLCAFVGSYFLNLTANNSEQYLAVVAIVFMDGFFGIWAGVKTEGFRTYKAIKVLQTLMVWIFMLTGILMIEKGFEGTTWLSETVCAPFILFQLVSALKNAERAGLIKNELLTTILDKIDKHKEINPK